MAIRIDTRQYQASHGHKPHQPRDGGNGAWAFRIDAAPSHIVIAGLPYKEALKQAKRQAQYSVAVLP